TAPVPGRAVDPVATAERLTGRRPTGVVGPLVAVAGDVVWFERERKVIRWDGRRERDEGSIGQLLASLALDWSTR
ncbi:MAG: hypothetical protein ABMB14_38010, partial [Myxococcota bacterium]